MSIRLATELKRSKYRLLGLVGQGQFGRVFCAAHRQTGRLVALKNLEHQRFSTHKFLRELRFLLSLQHPNIVTCKALEHTPTGRYLVMDYCEGGTLRTLVSGDYRLHLTQSLRLVADILEGLAHAHSKGIVHCDIKPENILLSLHPNGWVARISDFGIARLSQELAKEGTGNTGSPAYMAPERFYGQYSPTSDIYAVGVLFYEMLTGYRPFSGTPGELMSAHLNHPVEFPDTVPPACKPLLQTALQKLSARRFHSAQEMLIALRQVIAAQGWDQWVYSREDPLIRVMVPTTICEFKAQASETLPHPFQILGRSGIPRAQMLSLAPDLPSYWVGATDRQVQWYSMERSPVSHSTPVERTTYTALPGRVEHLWGCPQGCVAATSEGIFLIPFQPPGEKTPIASPPQPIPITALVDRWAAAVAPGGEWLAIASEPLFHRDPQSSSPAEPEGALAFFPLPWAAHTPALAPHAIPLPKAGNTCRIQQMFALDARHVGLFSTLYPNPTSPRNGSQAITFLEIFTRRGTRLGSLTLSFGLRAAIATSTPYQLLAIDAYNPCAVVLIDLKPYRVMRFGVEISPEFLVAAPWGYALANRQGQLVFLDPYGERVGRVEIPNAITAIALINDYTLLASAQQGEHGVLHQISLRDLNIDLLF